MSASSFPLALIALVFVTAITVIGQRKIPKSARKVPGWLVKLTIAILVVTVLLLVIVLKLIFA
jgi:hypothetical protein